jgi:hypothetical protein
MDWKERQGQPLPRIAHQDLRASVRFAGDFALTFAEIGLVYSIFD